MGDCTPVTIDSVVAEVEVIVHPVEVEIVVPSLEVEVVAGETAVEVTAAISEVGISYEPVDVEVTSTGQPGLAGLDARRISVVAGENLPAMSVVSIRADDKAYLASSADPLSVSALTGVLTHALLTEESGDLVTDGEVDTSSLTVGPHYLGLSGELTVDPNTGVVQQRMGYAVTPSRFIVRIEPGILHD